MLENESEDKKDGGRRMDKAVLINMLTEVSSHGRSADTTVRAAELISNPQGDQSVPGDSHEQQVPQAK
jgi:hypothetical protein